MKTKDLVLISLFASLIAICSWISIPAAVPFTMQTFAVFISLGLLGGKKGFQAILVYLLLGAVGLPVFAGFTSGFGVLLGSTGGYLWGFLGAALVYWGASTKIKKFSKIWLWSTMLFGLLLCYLFGSLWFYAIAFNGGRALSFYTVLTWCVFPFVLPDLLKIGLAIYLTERLRFAVKILPGHRSGSV
jgi:biotin transport system substrate-specific component